MLWIGVRKEKLTRGAMSFSDVGLELSCMQLAPRASLMLLLVGQPRFSSNRLEMVFLGTPLPTNTAGPMYRRHLPETNERDKQ